MTKEYFCPRSVGEHEVEIKKSRFLVRYCHCTDRSQAKEFIDLWRREFPDARHHCSAYLLGHPDNPMTMAFDDDGEPSGTAGKPMLTACQGCGVGDICVVVIRYFGGIKLGAGGLCRAYGGAVREALNHADLSTVIPKETRIVQLGFQDEQHLRYWLGKEGGEILEVVYTDNVQMKVSIHTSKLSDFRDFCTNKQFEIKNK